MFAQVTICGNAGRKPELRKTATGKHVCSVAVAVHGEKDATDWYEVTLWGKSAEFASANVEKGALVSASGLLTFHEYDASDGTRKRKSQVKAEGITLLGGRRNVEQGFATAAPAVSVPSAAAAPVSAPSHRFDDFNAFPF
jgi:single-strand DNA-binding protein